MPPQTQDIPVSATPDEIIIRQLVKQKRLQLADELGINSNLAAQYQKPLEHEFTRAQRTHTTVLFGGLTWKHEQLIQASMDGLGYRLQALPTPTVSAFQSGKEYGNTGQCNPTYFTVGNLVEYLQGLEQQGLSREQINEKYIFFTAGACGPCRFGMYEAEFRLALQNSGFEGFRVIIFQQKAGFAQAQLEAGMELNTDFFLRLINAFTVGDLLNEIAFQVRPYERNSGDTDRVLQESVDLLADTMAADRKTSSTPTDHSDADHCKPRQGSELWLHHLLGRNYVRALQQVQEKFRGISVDYFRVRPIVKVTGEFWAQTTEGDGNYHMFSFLESEGAQVLVEPIGTWIMYLLHQVKQKVRDRKGLTENAGDDKSGILRALGRRLRSKFKLAELTLGEKLFSHQWNRYRAALGGTPHPLVDQYQLQRIAHPYYNSRANGGEGHLEVAKNIYYSSQDLAHMVLSLKPFGCMPSAQSDGVQSAVINHFPDMTFLPIETSGEGEVNAHSRVQMSLGEAHSKARDEFKITLANCNHTLDEMQDYVAARPNLHHAMLHIPACKGVSGVAARFAHFVDAQMA